MELTKSQFNKNFSSDAQQHEYESWLAKVNDIMEVDKVNGISDELVASND
jgi:hypothetical protein